MARRVRSMLGILLLAALLVSSAVVPAAGGGSLPSGRNAGLLGLPLAAGENRVYIVSTAPGEAGAVVRAVEQRGGSVHSVLEDVNLVIGTLNGAAAAELAALPQVAAIAPDRPVRLDDGVMQRPEGVNEPAAAAPGDSLRLTTAETRALQFRQQTGYDGKGVAVAVLDTGVDPGHPDLQAAPDGRRKLVDYQDFTGEGDVATTGRRPADIPSIPSLSGTYRTGVFRESQIGAGEMGQDINRNGKKDDEFAVLVTDANKKGVYDTVYVDTNMNGDFTDEKPLMVFADRGDVGLFGSGEPGPGGTIQGVHFAVSRIDANGASINLGFDGAAHGTHVAGIIAANGETVGAAPGAQVMAIKVLTSGGSGSWVSILKGMHYAAKNGAKVINMSLGGLQEINDGQDPQSLFVSQLAMLYNTVIVIAGGNAGPGLNSIALPGVASDIITVGAYISPATFALDYGIPGVPEEGLWFFSSNGPREDGVLKPTVVAPGTANAPTPQWLRRHSVFQGTSMATPQTAGSAALLLSAAQAKGLNVRYNHVRQALQVSARRLEGYGWNEQGYGLIQTDAAWDRLPALAKEPALAVHGSVATPAGKVLRGLYLREHAMDETHTWSVVNRSWTGAGMNLTYHPGAGGLTASGPAAVSVGGLSQRAIDVQYRVPNAPGFYDQMILGTLQNGQSVALEMLTSYVVPHELSADKMFRLDTLRGSLPAARYERHFVRVPPGTLELRATLAVPQGRARLQAYDPDGMPAGATPYAGAPSGPNSHDLVIRQPAAGVWELDVYASHGAGLYGAPVSQYALDVAAAGVYATPGQWTIGRWGGRTKTFTFLNFYEDFRGGAATAGWVKPEVHRLKVDHIGWKNHFFTVEEGTAVLKVALTEVTDPTAKINFALYYADPQTGWRTAGKTVFTRDGQEVVLLAPKAGQYAVEINGENVPSVQTGVTFLLWQVRDGSDLKAKDTVKQRPLGSTWQVPVSVRVPWERGPRLGAVMVKNEADGTLLAVVPVELK